MTSKQRAYLKSIAANLDPIMQIGKSNLTPEITNSVLESFNNREILKISVLKNSSEDPREIAQMIADRTGSEVVQVIGKKIVLYRYNKENKEIEHLL